MSPAAGPPPVVYIGPSAPVGEIRAILPDAVFRPPAARGALHRDRLLRFGLFLLLDGVFAQDEALSPREVVDVLRDGAMVVGAASMGALRAADCAPAGAVGIGAVYRLLRRGALSSEDEVAVTYIPEAPFPAVTQSLVNVRVALRRAWRAGALTRLEARRAVAVAADLHYGARSWTRILRDAGLADPHRNLRPLLAGIDIKRADSIAAARWLAAQRPADQGWPVRPRLSPGVFGLLSEGRARAADPLRGRSEAALAPGFTLWLLASGRATPFLKERCIDALRGIWLDRTPPEDGLYATPADDPELAPSLRSLYPRLVEVLRTKEELHAEWFRYLAIAEHDDAGESGGLRDDDMRMAEAEIARGHGFETWGDAVAAAGPAAPFLADARRLLARAVRRRPAVTGG